MTQHPVPQHVAIIMDGNGRWAKAKGLPRAYGHVKGANAADKIIDCCIEKGIKVLTVFAFGVENWRRSQIEVSVLSKLFFVQLRRKISSLHQRGVRVKFIGDVELFGERLVKEKEKAEALTKDNTALTLVIAASYSGQWDICQATRALATKVQRGELSVEDITPETFQPYLATQDLPMVDLFIRTSGEHRISNFLLWQLAYAELYFTTVAWPDFSMTELEVALEWFAQRERRFGKTSEQLV